MNSHLSRLQLIQEYKWRLLAGFCIMLVTVALQLSFPQFAAYFIDNIDALLNQQQLQWYILLVAAVIVIQALATAARYYIFESTGQLIVKKTRDLLHRALVHKSVAFFDLNSATELASRLANDVEQLQDTLTMGLAISIRSVCILLGSLVMLLWISPLLSVVLVLMLPLHFLFSRWLGNKMHNLAADIQQKFADNSKLGYEHLSNIRLIQAFNGQHKVQANYQQATQHYHDSSLRRTQLVAKAQGATMLLMYLAVLLIFILGAWLIGQGKMTIGELTSFILYAGMLTSCTTAISDFWSSWMNAVGATARVFSFIEQAPSVSKVTPIAVHGDISFDKVCFSYPSRPSQPILHNVSFSIKAGQRVALLGRSGAGKSTIVNLLLGFYQSTAGAIYFDDKTSAELSTEAVRQHIALVEQEPTMFSGSIRDNIAYAAEHAASDDDIIAAAEQAYAMEFIARLPAGLDTLVGEKGLQLSGGQKQRIAIARALLRNPKILILDEATSALDSRSEQLVQQGLARLMQGRTTVIIAHSITNIAACDSLIMLDKASAIQTGRYSDLTVEQQAFFNQLMNLAAAGKTRPSAEPHAYAADAR